MSEVAEHNGLAADHGSLGAHELVAQQPPRKRGGIPGNRGGQKGRSGPPGHAKRLIDGAYCTRLTLPEFPTSLASISRAVGYLRRPLEEACREIHGTVDPGNAAAIREALTQERLARTWAKRMREQYDSLDDEDLARITDRIERHTRLCTAAIRSLELRSKKPEGFWDAKSAEAKPAT